MRSNNIHRINQISNHLISNKKKFIGSSYDYLEFDSFLTNEESEFRLKLRNYLEKNITHKMIPYIEEEDFPIDQIRKLNKEFKNLCGFSLKGFSSPQFTNLLSNVLISEVSRSEPSIASFLVTQGELVIRTINELGTDFQKAKYLKKLIELESIGCFVLNEKSGANVNQIKTTAKKVENGYIINGEKSWIGGATISDVFIIWAIEETTKKLKGFLIDKGTVGLSTEKISGKLSMMIVQSGNIKLKDVFVREEYLLNSNDLEERLTQIQENFKLKNCWLSVGISIGCYDRSIKYALERFQFGKPIASFQLIQLKLVKMMGNTQAMLYMLKEATDLFIQGKSSSGKSSLAKVWITMKLRETAGLAREVFGGNGILIENWVIKAMADSESLYSSEGSFDDNILICGSEIIGMNSTK